MHERLCTLPPVLVRAAVRVYAHAFVLGTGIPWLDRMLYIL